MLIFCHEETCNDPNSASNMYKLPSEHGNGIVRLLIKRGCFLKIKQKLGTSWKINSHHCPLMAWYIKHSFTEEQRKAAYKTYREESTS